MLKKSTHSNSNKKLPCGLQELKDNIIKKAAGHQYFMYGIKRNLPNNRRKNQVEPIPQTLNKPVPPIKEGLNNIETTTELGAAKMEDFKENLLGEPSNKMRFREPEKPIVLAAFITENLEIYCLLFKYKKDQFCHVLGVNGVWSRKKQMKNARVHRFKSMILHEATCFLKF